MPWCWYTAEMMMHPAFSGASINCRRFVTALEVENMAHAGTENGNLIVTYNQLERVYGISRRLIRASIDEAVRRGLVEERRGLRLSYAKSSPTKYRLTFRPACDSNSPRRWTLPTDEWKRYRNPD
jgi:hypothetical protein